jgi:hypothetical protein
MLHCNSMNNFPFENRDHKPETTIFWEKRQKMSKMSPKAPHTPVLLSYNKFSRHDEEEEKDGGNGIGNQYYT